MWGSARPVTAVVLVLPAGAYWHYRRTTGVALTAFVYVLVQAAAPRHYRGTTIVALMFFFLLCRFFFVMSLEARESELGRIA